MISKFAHGIIRRYFALAHFIRVYPYVYDRENCQLKLGSTFKWHIVSLLILSHGAFTTVRIFYAYLFQDGRLEDLLFRFFFVGACGLACTNQINSLAHHEEIESFYTMFLRFDRNYTGLYEARPPFDLLGIFVGFLFPNIVMGQVTTFAGIYLFNPKSPNFFNSFLSTAKYSVESFFMGIPEVLIFFVAWSSVFWSLLTVFTFQMSTIYWLEQMTMHDLDSKTTRSVLRQPRKTMMSYRQLQILNRMFNNVTSTIYQPLHTFCMNGLFITSAFTTIHCYGDMHWFAYLLSPITAIAILIYDCISYPTAAKILDHSDAFLHSWYKLSYVFKGQIPEFEKFLASCPKLRIKMGKQYHIHNETLFIMVNVMINQTISLLVAVRMG